MTISLGNIGVIVVLLGVFVRIHVFANRIEKRLCEHDEMWLTYCLKEGRPVSQSLMDRFMTVNGWQAKAKKQAE